MMRRASLVLALIAWAWAPGVLAEAAARSGGYLQFGLESLDFSNVTVPPGPVTAVSCQPGHARGLHLAIDTAEVGAPVGLLFALDDRASDRCGVFWSEETYAFGVSALYPLQPGLSVGAALGAAFFASELCEGDFCVEAGEGGTMARLDLDWQATPDFGVHVFHSAMDFDDAGPRTRSAADLVWALDAPYHLVVGIATDDQDAIALRLAVRLAREARAPRGTGRAAAGER